MKQVVSIATDGTISTLQHKGGKGLDLRTLGVVDIQRASEVRWNEDEQAWYVVFCIGAGNYANWVLSTYFLLSDENYDDLFQVDTLSFRVHDISGILLFREYEDAVVAEIAVLDRLRLRGLLN